MTERARWMLFMLGMLLAYLAVLFWMPASVEAATVDLWMYQANHSPLPLCAVFPDGRVCKTDGYTSPTTLVSERTTGFTEVLYLRSGTIFDVYDGSEQSLRCFADAPGRCNGIGAPFNTPRFVDLPYFSGMFRADVVNGTPGTNNVRLITKARFWVNTVDPQGCVVGETQGAIYHSLFAYLLAAYDFGGVIGVRQNVVVFEAVSGYGHPNDWPRNGMRLERYVLDSFYGPVYGAAFEDATCRAGGACAGAYVAVAGGNGQPARPFSDEVKQYVKLPLSAPCGVTP